MPAPIDPGDFQSAPVGTAVAPPYRADAAAVNLRFTRLYGALTASTTGLDAASILDHVVTGGLIDSQIAVESAPLLNATWTPANLTWYWIPAPFSLVIFKPIRYDANVNFANTAVFGMMPVGRRPDSTCYFAGNRILSGSAGSMAFSIDEDGIMAARQNFNLLATPMAFTDVCYRVA